MDLLQSRLRYLAAIVAIAPAIAACNKSATSDSGVSTNNTARPTGFGSCPSGKFCISAPASASAPAPAPYEQCSAREIDPEEARQDAQPPMHNVSFDPEGTKAARAANPKACCYTWMQFCGGGRALRAASGDVVVSSPMPRADWGTPLDEITLEGLAPATRAALADHWTREAAFEHASIASFAQLSLDLLALGAPPNLVEDAHRAALDEIAHARACYAIATHFGGASIGPSALAQTPRGAVSLAALARATFVDGCVGESVAAAELAELSTLARSSTLQSLLASMASDEERHAVLAWKILAWARRDGGPAVAEAIAEARSEVFGVGAAAATCEVDVACRAFGRLDAASRASLRLTVLHDVVAPCLAALG